MAEIYYLGRVLDREKQAPINGAKVSMSLPGKEISAYTDVEGIYKIPIQFGNYNVLEGDITIEAKGYKTYSAFVRLSPEYKDLGDIRLTYPDRDRDGNDRIAENNIALPILAAIMVVFALIIAALTLPSPQETPPQETPDELINLHKHSAIALNSRLTVNSQQSTVNSQQSTVNS